MVDKLNMINTALSLTGNNEVNTEEDGTEEWRVGSAAYESAIKTLLGSHDWNFGTKIVALNRVGGSDDEDYEDAYAKPANTLGLAWVKVDNYPADWKILGNKVLVNASSGVKAKIVLQPEPDEMPSLFIEALTCLVKAGCYEGLNEDPGEARNQRAEAKMHLDMAKHRTDREAARRPAFVSRMKAVRNKRILLRP